VGLAVRQRLDQFLADTGLAASRARARDLIRRGFVLIDGQAARKASQLVDADVQIAIAPDVSDDDSRGAEKLRGALGELDYDPNGSVAIDVGASTGGFTQVLLDRGARHVYAVDVGTAQLHPRLATDPRVTDLSQTDARHIDRERIGEPIMAVVCDVSFISLTKALPAALTLAAPEAWCIALIKPQFEVGPEAIGKGGIVRDTDARARAIHRITAWFADDMGWRVDRVVPSPIAGGDGNAEWLIGARKTGGST
jgi:23S rRNA (cytidine1920-2'-O)/16S rRNA (cytidine1409-2'-O)-methyltransferase